MRQTRRSEPSQYPEERKSTETPLVVASECGSGDMYCSYNQKRLERRTRGGDSPVWVQKTIHVSKAGHVLSCLNTGGPPSKPKYSSVTDSGRVP